MKHLTMITLMLTLASAGAYAQIPVKMKFSGTGANSTIDLKYQNTSTSEENVAGHGTLGVFTFRNVRASDAAPQSSDTCQGLYFPSTAGSGVLRFEDGSLIVVTLTQGGDCIDLVQMMGHCVLTLTISGGTGRFKDASGVLTYNETARPVLADALNNPVLFTETGEITGTVSLAAPDGSQEEGR